MAKKKIETDISLDAQTSGDVKDNLAHLLADSLNKQFKDYKVAYFLDGSEETPTDLNDWVSFGASTLDLAVSNRPHGGAPVGRIGEITGLEASGKSLIASHLLANTQKRGGLAVYIDTENALNVDFLESIGVDTDKMLYVQLETVEDIFATIENIIEKVRLSNKDRLVTIVVDSVAGASTKVELEGDYDKDGWATAKAIIISKAMRKVTNMIGKQRICLVFTNQLREKLGVSFGDKWCVDPFTTKIKIRYKK
jgi:recombination protein RecA